STARQRSASPSKAMPASAASSRTRPASASRWVEPTPRLMLRPSGWAPIIVSRSWPSARSTGPATGVAAPLAQSRISRGERAERWPKPPTSQSAYRSLASSSRSQRPPPGSGPSRAASIATSWRSDNFLPSPPRNLMPLSRYGLWEAEMTQPRSASSIEASTATPGVGMTPASSATPPAATMPSTRAASSIGPLSRVSRPITIRAPGPATRAAAAPSDRAVSAVRSTPATPRTPSVPNSLRTASMGNRLALRELRPLASLLQARLLPLHHARVAGQEPGPLEVGAEVLVSLDQRPGDAVAHGARLAGDAAAVDPGTDVPGALRAADAQRGGGDRLQDLARKVRGQRLAIDHGLAGARRQDHPGDRVLPLAGAAVHHGGLAAHERSSIGTGFCASCGCSGPA